MCPPRRPDFVPRCTSPRSTDEPFSGYRGNAQRTTASACVASNRNFFIDQKSPPEPGEYQRKLKSILGEIRLTRQQALSLEVKPSSQLSPYLEMCCLRVSANNSYRQATEEIAVLTGAKVSLKTQQRLVHRQDFSPATVDATTEVSQLSLDGGNIRLLTPKGEPSTTRRK